MSKKIDFFGILPERSVMGKSLMDLYGEITAGYVSRIFSEISSEIMSSS